MKDYIYLDNNATTKVDPKVIEAIHEDLSGPPANPSSNHFLGKRAKNLLIQSKKTIANYLNVDSNEIIFTSGGTETMNLLIRGVIQALGKGHIISTDIEHACIHKTLLDLEKKGCEISFIKTGTFGSAKAAQVKELIKESTKLIVLSAVNSETGVLTEIDKISQIAEEEDICFVIDCVALLGKKRIVFPKKKTAAGFSSHKIHGPKGIGFAYISKDLPLSPIILGGHQENNLRPGSENLPGIIGTSKAIELAYEKIDENINKISELRDYFEATLSKHLKIEINGEGPRICNTSNISFIGIDAEDLLIRLDLNGVLASHGSACQSLNTTLSRVLLNMGLGKERAKSAIRFSFSRLNTKTEIDKVIEIIIEAVKQLI